MQVARDRDARRAAGWAVMGQGMQQTAAEHAATRVCARSPRVRARNHHMHAERYYWRRHLPELLMAAWSLLGNELGDTSRHGLARGTMR
jgi:hypothetical protein